MLDTIFKRPQGDIGNAETFSFPVLYEVVEQATTERVVKLGDQTLIQPFIQAAKRLENKGAKAITTSCGFLALFQKEIQNELIVPFFSSSLMQIPFVHLITGGKVGVLTARKSSLTKEHFQGVNADLSTVVIEGMDDMPAFRGAIIEETEPLNMSVVAEEMKQATSELIKNNPEIRSIVLECTNMPPYKNALREVTDLPIFDITTLTNYVFESLLNN